MADKYVTRQTLLMRAKNQDDNEAWEEFISFYERFIYHILHKMNIHTNDFDDLVQVVLIDIWKGLASYTVENCKFRTWLSKVTRNTVLTYLTRKQRLQTRQEQMGEHQAMTTHLNSLSDTDLEAIIEEEWRVYIMDLALERIRNLFSGQAVDAFLMSRNDKSAEEISKALGVKKESVYVLISRVKSKFVEEMRRLLKELEF